VAINSKQRRHHRGAYHPVLSDEPVEILQPRKRTRRIAVVNAAAIIAAAIAAATAAGSMSQNHIAITREQLLAEITSRGQAREVADERARQAICVLLRREQQQTPDIRAARSLMRCR
jgi:hypothetical protein